MVALTVLGIVIGVCVGGYVLWNIALWIYDRSTEYEFEQKAKINGHTKIAGVRDPILLQEMGLSHAVEWEDRYFLELELLDEGRTVYYRVDEGLYEIPDGTVLFVKCKKGRVFPSGIVKIVGIDYRSVRT